MDREALSTSYRFVSTKVIIIDIPLFLCIYKAARSVCRPKDMDCGRRKRILQAISTWQASYHSTPVILSLPTARHTLLHTTPLARIERRGGRRRVAVSTDGGGDSQLSRGYGLLISRLVPTLYVSYLWVSNPAGRGPSRGESGHEEQLAHATGTYLPHSSGPLLRTP